MNNMEKGFNSGATSPKKTEQKWGGLTEEEIKEAYPRLLQFCKHMCKDDTLAEDIAQNTMLQVAKTNAGFARENNSSINTWLLSIARNAYLDLLRKRSTTAYPDRDPQNTIPIEETSEYGSGPETPSSYRWTPVEDPNPSHEKNYMDHEYLMTLLSKAKLNGEDRNLLLLKEQDGYSVEELSRMTGLNENTIKVKLFRVREKLREAAQRISPKK